MTRIPTRPREARWELPADPRATAACRALVRVTLAEWGLRDLTDDVTVVVTELLANALIHGEPPIHLTLRRAHGALVGAVTDLGPGRPRLLAAAADLEHGRGLRIVDALTDSWGVDPLPGGAGKTIWFARAEPDPVVPRPQREEYSTNTLPDGSRSTALTSCGPVSGPETTSAPAAVRSRTASATSPTLYEGAVTAPATCSPPAASATVTPPPSSAAKRSPSRNFTARPRVRE
ncbi:anti-sigma regulatory factor (Ser/Thr protein kinase) [Sphaerisporangium siamense]|uniref:Anti-sigma regulatory factor (Ser/Thr protein kinase) n=1 Tax=Sphaerisporangium siamense TaxID=795645 RepID=A0A7W7GEH2_9ACTN|nr:anti-sigma regulatory factor (Ser/Thr protein kinase) [Sphaerisporangium siamense]